MRNWVGFVFFVVVFVALKRLLNTVQNVSGHVTAMFSDVMLNWFH